MKYIQELVILAVILILSLIAYNTLYPDLIYVLMLAIIIWLQVINEVK